MKKLILFAFVLFLLVTESKSQVSVVFNEGFETYDSLTIPTGWSVWNNTSYGFDPQANWTVRDTGRVLPGVNAIRTSTAHTGHKSIGVSWYTGVDTLTGASGISDAWLVTKKMHIYSTSANIQYYVSGGTPTLKDSLQIWVSTADSLPAHFTHKYATVVLGPGPWGVFGVQYVLLSAYVGQNVYVGFRYNMDVSVDGVFVQLDDIKFVDVIGVKPIGTEIPKTYDLKQNYPNPFNPVTNIEFSIPKTSFTSLKVYDILGREIKSLISEEMKPGSYKVDFDATDLPSGSYFYRLEAGDYTKTAKMVLVK